MVGVLAGAGSAFALLANGQMIGSVRNGEWLGNRNAGSTAADPYTRAVIARTGLLALSRQETIYFTAYEDASGRRLSERCTYELSGGRLPARWWSVTIYAPDNYLPVNGDDAQSVDATHLGNTGPWTARVAPVRDGVAHWISSRNAGDFSLTLRLYHPGEAARSSAATIPFPQIRRLSCGKEAS
jgi:hypothetical protein